MAGDDDAPYMPRPSTLSGNAEAIKADIDRQIAAAQPKHALASKTVWLNILAVAAALGGAFGVDLGLTPETQGTLAVAIVAVVNIILRFTTTKGVKVR